MAMRPGNLARHHDLDVGDERVGQGTHHRAGRNAGKRIHTRDASVAASVGGTALSQVTPERSQSRSLEEALSLLRGPRVRIPRPPAGRWYGARGEEMAPNRSCAFQAISRIDLGWLS